MKNDNIGEFLNELKSNFGIVPNEQVVKLEYWHDGRRMITTVDFNPTTGTYHTGTVRDKESFDTEEELTEEMKEIAPLDAWQEWTD